MHKSNDRDPSLLPLRNNPISSLAHVGFFTVWFVLLGAWPFWADGSHPFEESLVMFIWASFLGLPSSLIGVICCWALSELPLFDRLSYFWQTVLFWALFAGLSYWQWFIVFPVARRWLGRQRAGRMQERARKNS